MKMNFGWLYGLTTFMSSIGIDFMVKPHHNVCCDLTELIIMSNVNRLREDVEDVKGQMVQNIEKVIDRGERLDDLNERTENLNARAGEFQTMGTRLKRKLWWQNVKLWIILIIIIVVILAIIIIAIAVGVSQSD